MLNQMLYDNKKDVLVLQILKTIRIRLPKALTPVSPLFWFKKTVGIKSYEPVGAEMVENCCKHTAADETSK